jgi:hypothetical protein
MALLDEQLVEEWLNSKNFFTMRGIKLGNDEIDLLAHKSIDGVDEYWHIEVQISYRPIGYVGGNNSAKKRDDDELRIGTEEWVEKKYKSEKKIQKRNSIAPNAVWKYIFVYGVLRNDKELELIKKLGVEVIPYKTVLNELMNNSEHKSSSIANNITEILQFIK